MSVKASKWGLIASGTTVGGLSARYCLRVSASMVADMFLFDSRPLDVTKRPMEMLLEAERGAGGTTARAWAQRGVYGVKVSVICHTASYKRMLTNHRQ